MSGCQMGFKREIPGELAVHLEALQGEALESLQPYHGELRPLLEYALSPGGKGLRALLFFAAMRVFRPLELGDRSVALAFELLHGASLLHDDVVDAARERRGRPSFHRIWGPERAVLLGDFLYAKASALLMGRASLELMELFSKMLATMTQGELLQSSKAFHWDLEEELYLQILEAKTGSFLGACCQSAGLLAAAAQGLVRALEAFGRELGQAFQLQDDALDYGGQAFQGGKDRGADLRAGRVTLPLILLRESLDAKGRKALLSMPRRGLGPEERSWIWGEIHRKGLVEKALSRSRASGRRALAYLEKLPAGKGREELASLAHLLLGDL